MIKELILSLALSAASSLPFLDSPKKAVDWNEYDGFGATITYVGLGGTSEFSGMFASGQRQIPLAFTSGGDFDTDWFTVGRYEDRDRVHFYGYWNMLNGQYHFQFLLSFYLDPNNWEEDVQKIDELETFAEDTGNYPISNLTFTSSTVDEGPYEEDGEYYYSKYFDVFFSPTGLEQGAEFSAGWAEPQPQTYTLSKSFVNCTGYVVGSGGVLSPLPSSYTQADLQNPYTCRFYASEGYYFDNRTVAANITQSGGIVISDVVFDVALNNDRYTSGFSCSITLPLANCSLSAVANAMTYTITSELNRCSVSGLPSTYTNELSGSYVFIAASNYGFNKNSVSYEITGATYEVSYSGVLYGDFYQNLTISIEAHFSNVSIRVTAVSYDPDPYQQGFSDGEKKGYQEGKIAGNSYGVWNWLKQAALTTGEFLNIPLLPGFSLGGLLTAIAGLVIIWLFIKGFLFKS